MSPCRKCCTKWSPLRKPPTCTVAMRQTSIEFHDRFACWAALEWYWVNQIPNPHLWRSPFFFRLVSLELSPVHLATNVSRCLIKHLVKFIKKPSGVDWKRTIELGGRRLIIKSMIVPAWEKWLVTDRGCVALISWKSERARWVLEGSWWHGWGWGGHGKLEWIGELGRV